METKFKLGEYIIANNKYYNPTPFKIKVTEITKCTISFDNLDSDIKNIRMFIEKMEKEYDIIEDLNFLKLETYRRLLDDKDDLPF